MSLPLVGSVNWMWLLIGIALGWIVIPRVSAMIGA